VFLWRQKKRGCKPTEFFILRVALGIPIHQHITDGEIYFGGVGGLVILQDCDQNEIGKFHLERNFFSVVSFGEWHGLEAAGETFLFGVKFSP
jgi:hypothetical protein